MTERHGTASRLPAPARGRKLRAGEDTVLLDIRTTIMIAAGLALLTGVSLRYVLRDYPESSGSSIRLWIFGNLLQAAAWVLYGLRDTIPDLLAIVVANALLSFAFARQIDAIRLFVGRPPSWLLSAAPVAAIALLEIVFTYALPSMRMRLLTVSAIFALQMLVAAAALLDGPRPYRRSHLLTASAFLTLSGILVLRIAIEGLSGNVLPTALASSPVQSAVFAVAALFPIVATLGFVLMCTDRLHQELEQQARVDPLTGISNRRTLGELAEAAIAAAHRDRRGLALLLVDADHFKRINDVFGHEVGDDALRVLATTLDCASRSTDILGRLGGEEFVVVLADVDERAARALAERLRVAVENTAFDAGGERLPLRVSIGFSICNGDDDFPALLRRADKAMYLAKRLGRNRVVGPRDLETTLDPIAGVMTG
jgi:diguanylate cyclase (GGDEF)-like protein